MKDKIAKVQEDCNSIQNITQQLKDVKKLENIRGLSQIIDQLDVKTEDAIGHLDQIEKSRKRKKSRRHRKHKHGDRKKSDSQEGDYEEIECEENVDKSMFEQTQGIPTFKNKFSGTVSHSSTMSAEGQRKSESPKLTSNKDNFDDEENKRSHRRHKTFTKEKKKKNKSGNLVKYKRETLPAFKTKTTINVFKILKDSIGKDLTKFCVPVYFNEPLSMLQRTCEIMRNEETLNKAVDQKDSLLRLAYLAAFCIGQYHGTENRISKPSNPVLGETFEFKTKNWKFIAEQVSHHPPISAAHCKGKGYEIWVNTHLKSKFNGKNFEVKPLGSQKFMFKDTGDLFEFIQPNTTANNIVIGKLYIDHKGECILENKCNGERAVIKFCPLGMFTNKSKRGMIEGRIEDAYGNAIYELFGKWTEGISFKQVGESDDSGTLAWSPPELPPDCDQLYNFSKFALQLNVINDHLEKKIPPTDSRYRTDQRCLEEGDIETANGEKKRIEEKQRKWLKDMDYQESEYKARYFEKEDEESNSNGIVSYKYLKNYWEDRKQHNWDNMPNLFA